MNDATPFFPAPMVPAECDLSGLPSMLLDIGRLFGSDFYNLATGDEFRAGVTLWGKSWEQSPPASLSSDDRILARLAGVSLSEWKDVAGLALRNWVRCTDGRLYHPVVAEKALLAWLQRIKHRERSARANAARNKTSFDPASFDRLRAIAEAHLARVAGTSDAQVVLEVSSQEALATPTRSDVGSYKEPSALLEPSEGEGEGEEERKTPPEGARCAESEPAVTNQNSEAWNRGVRLLAGRGRMRDGQARSLFGKLLRDSHLQASEVLPAIIAGEANGTQEPQAYLRKAAEGVARRKGSLPVDGRSRSGRLGGWTATGQALAFGGDVEVTPADPATLMLEAAA